MNIKKIVTAAGAATAACRPLRRHPGQRPGRPGAAYRARGRRPAVAGEGAAGLASLVGKAAKSVGKAATKGANKATAVGKGMAVVAKSNADNMLSHGSIFAPPADLPQGVSADSVFDR